MRFFKLGVYHPAYIRNFYTARPELALRSYAVQHEHLISDLFGSADFWTKALQKFGYETIDVIANVECLQKAWARENDVVFEDENWLFEIAARQIEKFRPDILFIADYTTFTSEFIKEIRGACPSIRLVLGWCGAGFYDLKVFREWDATLSCIPEMAAEFNRQGIRSFHVDHAFAPRVLDKLDLKSAPDTDFAFVGSIVLQNKFHTERERLLRHLIESTNLRIWSDIKRPTMRARSAVSARRSAYRIVKRAQNAGVPNEILKNLPLIGKAFRRDSSSNSETFVDERIRRRAAPALFGVEMFQKLRNSRIVFNNHIDVSPRSASNMRLFEATGVGACLITDWKENISELFAPDEEILTYRSAAECAEKVNYLLAHENTRRKIAEKGQQRTLSRHTFENRAAKIDEIIRRHLISRK